MKANEWEINLFDFQSCNSSWSAGSDQSFPGKAAQDQRGLDLLLEGVWEEMQIIIQKQTAGVQEKWGAAMNYYYVLASLISLPVRKEWDTWCLLPFTYIYFSRVFIYILPYLYMF